MKKRRLCLVVVWMVVLVALSDCRPVAIPHDALLYPPDPATTCSSALSSGGTIHDLKGYDALFDARNHLLDAVWHDPGSAILIIDQDRLLHAVYMNTERQVSNIADITTVPIAGVATSRHLDLLAIDHIWYESERTVSIQSIGDNNRDGSVESITRTSSPVWHPSEPMLAGAYYPKGFANELGTFSVATYLVPTDGIPLRIYELEHYAIAQVLGWSSDGDILTITQFRPTGVIPFHLQVEDGSISGSAFQRGCIENATWSPRDRMIAYQGQTEEGLGWDIFLEIYGSTGEASLINITDTPMEDEWDLVWSPDGTYLAYAKTFVNHSNELRQELFLVDPHSTPRAPRQLSDTPDAYETKPMWLSDREIAYLSWSPDESAWYLKMLSITEPQQPAVIILKLPESWYRMP